MKHGYTNDNFADGRQVVKRYRGPDADVRQRREVAIYVGLAGQLPLPALIGVGPGHLTLERRPGVPGQELLEEQPAAVLRQVGRLARRIQGVDVDRLELPGPPPSSAAVLVHGDFGPQNLLMDADSAVPTAVVDWELAHFGDPVSDIAWAEWIVRMHHSPLMDHLPALFDGFGEEPAWSERQAAMISMCEWALDFVRRWQPGETPASAQWRERLRRTRDFDEFPTGTASGVPRS